MPAIVSSKLMAVGGVASVIFMAPSPSDLLIQLHEAPVPLSGPA